MHKVVDASGTIGHALVFVAKKKQENGSMKYLDAFKHSSTYFFAFWIEIVTTHAQLYSCLQRKDYGCVLGNFLIVAWWVFVASVLRYFYLRQRGKQINPAKTNPSTDGNKSSEKA